MHIVVIGTRGFPNVQGGVERHCEQLYPLLAGLGQQVTVLTRKPYVDPAVSEYCGVRLVPVDCPRHKFLEAFVHSFKAVFLAKKLKADILHVHAVGPSLVVPLARLLGLKVVITHHGPDYERKKWNWAAKLVLKTGEACGCLFANRIITIAGYLARHIKYKFSREAVVIPNGVVIPDRGRPVAGNDKVVLQEYGLEAGRYILTVGRFVPEKGYHDLVAAFRAGNRQPAAGSGEQKSGLQGGWKLVIVGDADHEDDYSRKLKADAEAVPGVVLTGRLTGAPLFKIYSNAGLFVLPSYYEGLPIVLLEAMSYGLNCIVSDIPANREVALDASRYFQPGDIEGLAARLSEFTRRPLSPSERSAQLDLIAREYDWGVIARRTMEVYKSLDRHPIREGKAGL